MFATPVLALCLLPIHEPVPAPNVPAERELKQTIQNSVGFLRREGQAWIKDRGCVSCHQVPAMLWSLGEVKRLDLSKDDLDLEQLSKWSVEWEHWRQPDGKEKQKDTESKNVDTITNLLLARGVYAKKAPWVTSFADVLLREQKKDGSWQFGGQLGLQHRPPAESKQVTTMWTLLALHSTEKKDLDKPTARAMAWVQKQKEGTSTEWLVTRALVEKRFGDAKKAEAYLQTLLKEQNKDGGWGWLRGRKSDAFGTGLVLYTLAQMGETKSEAVTRARRFLQTTQQKDGSWPVPTTLKRRKDRLEPTSVYWGTAWAVIGLAQSMEPTTEYTEGTE